MQLDYPKAIWRAAHCENYKDRPSGFKIDGVVLHQGVNYRGQGFSKAIVYAQVGDWGNIEEIAW